MIASEAIPTTDLDPVVGAPQPVRRSADSPLRLVGGDPCSTPRYHQRNSSIASSVEEGWAVHSVRRGPFTPRGESFSHS